MHPANSSSTGIRYIHVSRSGSTSQPYPTRGAQWNGEACAPVHGVWCSLKDPPPTRPMPRCVQFASSLQMVYVEEEI